MNTTEPYERRTDRTVTEPTPAPASATEIPALAVHKDPSLDPEPGPGQRREQPHASIVWVRPADLVSTVGAARLSKAVDVQADVIRRTRRVPSVAATRLRGRINRSAIARSEPAVRTSASRSKGVHL